MPLTDDAQSSSLLRAIALLEEALGILDRLGLAIAAAKLDEALDSTRKAQAHNNKL